MHKLETCATAPSSFNGFGQLYHQSRDEKGVLGNRFGTSFTRTVIRFPTFFSDWAFWKYFQKAYRQNDGLLIV